MDVCRKTTAFSRTNSAGAVARLLYIIGRRRVEVGFEHEKNVPPAVRRQITGNGKMRLNHIPQIFRDLRGESRSCAPSCTFKLHILPRRSARLKIESKYP